MKPFRTLGKLLIKASLLVILCSLVLVRQSSSFYSDLEVSDNNAVNGGALDLVVVSQEGSFNNQNMKKGDSQVRHIDVTNNGNMDFSYRGEATGSGDLCSVLQLKVEKGATVWYNGLLKDFKQFNLEPSLTPTNNDNLIFTLTLPNTVNTAYSQKDCHFKLNFIAWQAELTEQTTGFSDKEVLDNNEIIADNFEKPCIPTLHAPENNAKIKDNDPQFKWDNCVPENKTKGYYIRTYKGGENNNVWPTEDGYFTAQSHYNSTPLADDSYWWQVRAEGTNGILGDWSDKWKVTIDTTGPSTSLYASNSPEREIKEDVKNGDFDGLEEGLEYWEHTDNVYVSQKDEGDVNGDGQTDYLVNPHDIPENPDDNYNMAVIKPMAGNNTKYPGVGDDFYYGMITQQIPNEARTLSFWYNFATLDTAGYDNPGLAVFLNDKQIYQIWAQDINYPPESPKLSDWQKFYFDLTSIDNTKEENKFVTLVFFSGNRQDNKLDSWVYLDKISTADLVVNSDTKIILKAKDGLSDTKTYFKRGKCGGSADKEEYDYKSDGFTLDKKSGSDKLCFWSEDELGNKEGKRMVNIIYDNRPPAKIDDLKATNFGDDSFGLAWTVSNEAKTNLTGYDIRYLDKKVSGEAGWTQMQSVLDFMVLEAPRAIGELENYIIPPGHLESTKQYWFAVKARDAAGNWSRISNIATVKPPVTMEMQSLMGAALETQVELKLSEDKKSVEFTANGISSWQKLSYQISYDSDQGEQGIVGTVDIPEETDSLTKTDLKLGSCSAVDKEVCTYNTGITKIKLTIVLTGSGMPDRTLEKELTY